MFAAVGFFGVLVMRNSRKLLGFIHHYIPIGSKSRRRPSAKKDWYMMHDFDKEEEESDEGTQFVKRDEERSPVRKPYVKEGNNRSMKPMSSTNPVKPEQAEKQILHVAEFGSDDEFEEW